jgi:hypothetical protein
MVRKMDLHESTVDSNEAGLAKERPSSFRISQMWTSQFYRQALVTIWFAKPTCRNARAIAGLLWLAAAIATEVARPV